MLENVRHTLGVTERINQFPNPPVRIAITIKKIIVFTILCTNYCMKLMYTCIPSFYCMSRLSEAP
jgi:hypothetical protein